MSRSVVRILNIVLVSAVLAAYNNCSASFHTSLASQSSPSIGGDQLSNDQQEVILGKQLYATNCAACHGPLESSSKKNANVARIGIAIDSQPAMSGLTILTDSQIRAIASSLSATVSEDSLACASAPDVGFVVMHRLNQFEYRNTIRSLTGVALSADASFPSEEISEFPNTAILLKTTAAQFDWYLNTAISVIDTVMASATLKAQIYTCDLSVATCWQNAIQAFASKAYRRPATSEEITQLRDLYQSLITKSATADVALGTVLQGILVSPQFLYRYNTLTDPANVAVRQKLNGYELASRISYFIWGDAPDATLVQKALAGELDNPAALKAEVARLLADARAGDNLSQNFFTYWLGLNEFKNRTPDPTKFPEFTTAVRSDMMTESRLFFRDLVTENHPLADLLSADFTYMNQNLSSFYGMGGVTGSAFQKVSLTGSLRSGALTHGSLMTVTSHSYGTSIVRRGAFIALNLQCIDIPAPPGGVGTFPPPNGRDSIRVRLEAHRSNPQCISCHATMDPPGFGLESYSAIGKLRTLDDEGFPLDTSGVLFNGKTFNNARQLASELTADRSFRRCGVRKLATFALGRTMNTYDQCTIDRIVNSAGTKTLQDIISEIIASDFFRSERGG